jgi:hypothetical protein
MQTSAPYQEKGSTSFILEDRSSDGTPCVREALGILQKIQHEALPENLQHLRISSVDVRPLSVTRIMARLNAEKIGRRVYDVFLSYSTIDHTAAAEIKEALEKEGLRCFMASKEILGGETFSESIRNALLECSEVCILFTEHSRDSEWVTTEWGAAWALGKTTVPILLHTRSSELPDRLKALQCRDFHQLPQYVSEIVRRQEGREQRLG